MGQVIRIVAFGSSSTEGSGATSPDCTYPARLSVLLRTRWPTTPTEVLNKGVGGDTIRDMLSRLQRDVVAAHSGLVIWQVGSNDPLAGIGRDAFERGLAEGAAAITDSGSELIMMEPQWSPTLDEADPGHAFVESVRCFAQQHGLDNVRRFELMQRWVAAGQASRTDLVGSDGLHMTDLGYRLLAEAVCETIVRRWSGITAAGCELT